MVFVARVAESLPCYSRSIQCYLEIPVLDLHTDDFESINTSLITILRACTHNTCRCLLL